MVKRPPAGTIPEAPGSYQFKDAHGRVIYVGKASNLRQRLSNYFQTPAQPASAHGADGRDRRVGRVDHRAQRGRGADARVLAHQAARSPLQRAAARRQELSVPRGHRRRAVAAGAGHAGPQAQGHPLLRALRPCVRHPRHPRPLVEIVPDPHVQPGEVQPARAARSSVSAVPHREVRRPVRRRDRGDAVPATRHRADRVPRRRHRRDRRPARGRHDRGRDRPRIRASGAAARPPDRRAQGDREAADGRRAQRGPRRDRYRRGRTRGRRSRCSTCARAVWSAARASSSTRSRTSRPDA